MSNQINPNVLRIGTFNEWYSKFIEKKTIEFKNYLNTKIDLKHFFINYFFFFGLIIIFIRIYLSIKKFHIFIVFDYDYINIKINNNILLKKPLLTKFDFKKQLNIYKTTIFHNYLKKKYLFNYCKTFLINFKYKKINLLINFSRLKILDLIVLYKKKFKLKNKVCFKNNFLNKIKKILLFYFSNKMYINLTIKQLLKLNFYYLLSYNKKTEMVFNIISIRKFEQVKFFNSVINYIFRSYFIKNKIYLLSNLLKLKLNNFSKVKNLMVFFYFIKIIIKLFLCNNFILKNLLIKISGNLTKKQRSVNKKIVVGKQINLSKLNLKLYYSQVTIFSKKGVFGIKLYCN